MKSEEKLQKLKADLANMKSVIVAFSGGVDSTFLLKVAYESLGKRCIAVTADSASISRRELENAKKFTKNHAIEHIILKYEETCESEEYKKNPDNRCYYCKHILFSKLNKLAKDREIRHVLEGSNASDMNDHRPGMLAAKEFSIISPLKNAGLEKQEIRKLSRKMGLPTWNKPEMACLASRIPYGNLVTISKLKTIEQAESYIKSFGISQLRVRHFGTTAKIEVEKHDFQKIQSNLQKIENKFRKIGFTSVKLDPAGYRRGSLNEGKL